MEPTMGVCWTRNVRGRDIEFCDVNPTTPEKAWYESEYVLLLAGTAAICVASALVKQPSACLSAMRALFWRGER